MAMKNRFWAMLCAMALVLSVLPTTALGAYTMHTADDPDENPNGDFYQELAALIADRSGDANEAKAAAEDPYYSARLLVFAEDDLDTDMLETVACLYDGCGMWVVQFRTPDDARMAAELLAEMGIESQPDALIEGVEDDDGEEDLMSAQASGHLGWGAADCHYDRFISQNASSFAGSGVVAVIDSGVDATHLFLRGRVLQGYDFIDGDAYAQDGHGHGTHVASIVIDCVGSSPVSILPVRVLNNKGEGYSSTVASGVKYAANHDADVINISLGGEHDRALELAIEYAIDQGTITAIAAGNENTDASKYCPSDMTVPGAVVVASGDSSHKKAKHSNYGKTIDLMAPGVNIRAAIPGGKYKTMGGTSMATPHAAAAAVLLDLAWGKELSPAELERKLYTATSNGSRINDYYGYGFLDMAKASVPSTAPAPSEPDRKTVSVTPGTYRLEAYCGKVVEVADSQKGDRANVQIWGLSDRDLGCQKWQVAASGNGYVLTALHSGKALDIADGSEKPGANVWQWHTNDTPAQTWTFEDAGDGYVYLKSGLGTYLDVYKGNSVNGTNVISYSFNGGSNQKFKLVSVEEKRPGDSSSIQAGTYYIEAYCGKVVEVADSQKGDRANIQIWALSKRNLGCQKFKITPSGGGFVIAATHSGKAMDVADGSSASGTNVWQWHLNQTAAQTWTFEDAGCGYVYIRSGLGTYLTVKNNGTGNGTNIVSSRFEGGAAQMFMLKTAE